MSSPNGTPRDGNRSLGQIVSSITEDLSALIRGEIALAKAEIKQSAQEAATGAGLIFGAIFLSTIAFIFLLVALAYGIATVLPVWAGFLIVALLLLIITGILGYIARGRFQKVKGPERAQKQSEATREELKAVPQKFKDATERASQTANGSDGTTSVSASASTTSASASAGSIRPTAMRVSEPPRSTPPTSTPPTSAPPAVPPATESTPSTPPPAGPPAAPPADPTSGDDVG
jgi:hypothetical protein